MRYCGGPYLYEGTDFSAIRKPVRQPRRSERPKAPQAVRSTISAGALSSQSEGVRIELSDSALTDDLVGFLERCESPVDEAGSGVILMSRQRDDPIAGLRMRGYLRVWCKLHPGVAARLEDGSAAR